METALPYFYWLGMIVDSGNGNGVDGAALGRAKVLAESLTTLESVLGVDLRDLSHKIAANVGGSASNGSETDGSAKTG